MPVNIKLTNPPQGGFESDIKFLNVNKTGEIIKVQVPKGLNRRKIWFTAFHTTPLVNESWWVLGELSAFNRNATRRWTRPWQKMNRNGAVTPVYDDNGAGLSRSTLISWSDETILSVTNAEAAFDKDVLMLQRFGVFTRYVHPFEIFVDCDSISFNASDHRLPATMVTCFFLAVESSFGML